MFCKKCGRMNPHTTTACQYCGTPLRSQDSRNHNPSAILAWAKQDNPSLQSLEEVLGDLKMARQCIRFLEDKSKQQEKTIHYMKFMLRIGCVLLTLVTVLSVFSLFSIKKQKKAIEEKMNEAYQLYTEEDAKMQNEIDMLKTKLTPSPTPTPVPTYVLSFDPNRENIPGRSSTEKLEPSNIPDPITTHTECDLPLLEPFCSGYRFLGWNTEVDGSGTSYQPGAVFPAPTADITLYAQWGFDDGGSTEQKTPIPESSSDTVVH